MQLDGNGFFGDLKNLFEENNTSLFKTDTKTILGRNLVKNFVGKINFEIGMFGYSDTANEIAEFYSECLKNGGIIEFSTNPVIKMILEEIQYMPKVRNYLKDRIFDDIEKEKVENLNKIFENNEEIKEKLDKENKDFVKQKMLKEKEISKIMKNYKCNREQAEKIYENIKFFNQNNKKSLNIPLPTFNIDEIMEETFKKQFGVSDEKSNIEVIELDDEKTDTTNQDDDNFWCL